MKESRRPLVAEIKRNSLDDGPGVRSVVFFKGCILACVWCHNPECVCADPEIIFRADRCVGSRECVRVCPDGAIGEGGPAELDRAACSLCGDCADECPSEALGIVGRYYAPDDLVALLCEDWPFYENSGGGVTLSGGEPTVFMAYLAEIARRLRERRVHVLLETCGDFDWGRFESSVLPYLDAVYVDFKLESDEAHRKFTGRGNTRIKDNIERLVAAQPVEMLVRVPLIPEITTGRENLGAIAAWLAKRGVERVALMPYNPLWLGKAKALGRSPTYERGTWMAEAERGAVKKIFANFEIVRDF